MWLKLLGSKSKKNCLKLFLILPQNSFFLSFFFLLPPSSFLLLPPSFLLLPSSFFLLPSSFFLTKKMNLLVFFRSSKETLLDSFLSILPPFSWDLRLEGRSEEEEEGEGDEEREGEEEEEREEESDFLRPCFSLFASFLSCSFPSSPSSFSFCPSPSSFKVLRCSLCFRMAEEEEELRFILVPFEEDSIMLLKFSLSFLSSLSPLSRLSLSFLSPLSLLSLSFLSPLSLLSLSFHSTFTLSFSLLSFLSLSPSLYSFSFFFFHFFQFFHLLTNLSSYLFPDKDLSDWGWRNGPEKSNFCREISPE